MGRRVRGEQGGGLPRFFTGVAHSFPLIMGFLSWAVEIAGCRTGGAG
jgi:hypothetical protein